MVLDAQGHKGAFIWGLRPQCALPGEPSGGVLSGQPPNHRRIL